MIFTEVQETDFPDQKTVLYKDAFKASFFFPKKRFVMVY